MVPPDAIASGNRLSRYRIKEWAHNHVLDCLVSIFHDAVQAITLTPRMSLQLPLVRVLSWGTCTFTTRSWLPFVGSSLTLPSFIGSVDNPAINATLRHQDLDPEHLNQTQKKVHKSRGQHGLRSTSRLPACDSLHVWRHSRGTASAALHHCRQKDYLVSDFLVLARACSSEVTVMIASYSHPPSVSFRGNVIQTNVL